MGREYWIRTIPPNSTHDRPCVDLPHHPGDRDQCPGPNMVQHCPETPEVPLCYVPPSPTDACHGLPRTSPALEESMGGTCSVGRSSRCQRQQGQPPQRDRHVAFHTEVPVLCGDRPSSPQTSPPPAS